MVSSLLCPCECHTRRLAEAARVPDALNPNKTSVLPCGKCMRLGRRGYLKRRGSLMRSDTDTFLRVQEESEQAHSYGHELRDIMQSLVGTPPRAT